MFRPAGPRRLHLLKPSLISPDEAARQFIAEHFGGDATQAVLAVARTGDVAVAYQDRGCFESSIERPLTDDEWGRLRPWMQSYDEWLDDSGPARPSWSGDRGF